MPEDEVRKRIFLVHRKSMEAFEGAYGDSIPDEMILSELGDMCGEELEVEDGEVECVTVRRTRQFTCSLCAEVTSIPPGTMVPRGRVEFICYGCFQGQGDA